MSGRPRDSADRCAFRAELRDDPMLGTAFPASQLLLVEQPGAWGSSGLAQSDLAPEIALALERRAGALGVRVLAIRRPGRQVTRSERRCAYVDCRPGQTRVVWTTITDDAELLDLPLDGSEGDLDPSPLFLVCTHGSHDPCCAVRGRPVAAALAAVRGDRVWECTHLGGDRFAANVLVVPSGLMFGRVRADRAAEFADAAERGDTRAAELRGRVGFPHAVQAAMAFAHDLLDLFGSDDLVLVTTRAADDGTVVRLDTPVGMVDVVVGVSQSEPEVLTCHAAGAGRVWVHHLVRLERVAVPHGDAPSGVRRSSSAPERPGTTTRGDEVAESSAHQQETRLADSNPNAGGPARAAGDMGVSSERTDASGATDGERPTRVEPRTEEERRARAEAEAPQDPEENPQGIPPKAGYPEADPRSEEHPFGEE